MNIYKRIILFLAISFSFNVMANDCEAIDKKRYPTEYKMCKDIAKKSADSKGIDCPNCLVDDLSDCTRQINKEISCDEGNYIFVSGKTGTNINDTLTRESKKSSPASNGGSDNTSKTIPK